MWLAGPVSAQSLPERALGPSEIAEWQAVGRVNHGLSVQDSTCTGTLVSPTLVLTAGHCIGDGQALAFLPGSHAERPLTRLPVAGAALHPDHATPLELETIPNDLARLTLASATDITPLPLGPPPVPGETLALLSYRNGALDAPVMSPGCSVLDVRDRRVTLTCRAHSGMSGAPVIRFTNRGPELSAILIATAGQTSLAAVPDDWARR